MGRCRLIEQLAGYGCDKQCRQQGQPSRPFAQVIDAQQDGHDIEGPEKNRSTDCGWQKGAHHVVDGSNDRAPRGRGEPELAIDACGLMDERFDPGAPQQEYAHLGERPVPQ